MVRIRGSKIVYSFRRRNIITTFPMKVFIIPGNGSGDVLNCMWYPWVKKKLDNAGIGVISTISISTKALMNLFPPPPLCPY